MLGSYIHLDVLVPENDETEARSLIDELQERAPAPSQDCAKISQRRPAVAIMLALIFPGMGSLYVGRKGLGAWLAAGSALYLTTLYVQTHAGPSHHFLYAALGLLGLMSGDLASVISYRYRKRPQLTVISN